MLFLCDIPAVAQLVTCKVSVSEWQKSMASSVACSSQKERNLEHLKEFQSCKIISCSVQITSYTTFARFLRRPGTRGSPRRALNTLFLFI